MDPRQETLNLLNKIWTKLQGLPEATPVELGAFFVLLTFILVVVLMAALACVTCCCRCCCGGGGGSSFRKIRTKGPNI